jgi:predicted GNAT superfamily acetyltransferase
VGYTIRPCQTLDELAGCVSLQKRIWGYAEHEVYPVRLFITLTKIGGHVLGAFSEANELVGFVASMPAWHGRRRYYHSLSLGVLSAHENRGLGRSLKLAQREAALRAGIDRIEWTYDPMRAKNAFFNIERLGAIVRRYLPDHYGRVESRLQQGLPSDRLIAEWWLKSPRVERALAGKSSRPAKRKPAAVVAIPPDFSSLAKTRHIEAHRLQQAVRERLREHLARGLVITGFVPEKSGGTYVLDPIGAAGLPPSRSVGT